MKLSHDQDIAKQIEELSVPILDSIAPEEIENFIPYHQRYYENKYCTAFSNENENNDILLKFHTNRLILISIAEGHDIMRQEKVIEEINFNVNGVNMSDISISGKKKAGAKRLSKESILCYIKCKGDEKQYPIHTCVPSSLIEVNQHVLKNPQLLVTDYKQLGYIGVLYPQKFGPNASAINKMIAKLDLLSEEEYQKRLDAKTNSVNIIQTEHDSIVKDI